MIITMTHRTFYKNCAVVLKKTNADTLQLLGCYNFNQTTFYVRLLSISYIIVLFQFEFILNKIYMNNCFYTIELIDQIIYITIFIEITFLIQV